MTNGPNRAFGVATHAHGSVLSVLVVPRAGRSSIEQLADGTVQVRVAAPPVDGAAIRQTRLERYWSQKTLATHLGISVSYLSQLENSTRPPSAILMAKILAWLQTPQDF